MEIEQLKLVIESVLLVNQEPVTVVQIAKLFEPDERPEPEIIKEAFDVLRADLSERSFELVQVATGYRLQVKQDYSPWVKRLWQEKPPRYSRAILETLALIAYQQPITRAEIESVRGVAVSTNVIKTLLERDWIKVIGHRDVPGRPALLATTRQFLDYFNLQSLKDLPEVVEPIMSSAQVETAISEQLELDIPPVALADNEAAVDNTIVAEEIVDEASVALESAPAELNDIDSELEESDDELEEDDVLVADDELEGDDDEFEETYELDDDEFEDEDEDEDEDEFEFEDEDVLEETDEIEVEDEMV